MELRKIEDKGGEAMISKYYDGVHFPPVVPGNVKDHLEAVRNLKHKEGDILLNPFPKAGTHWTYDVLHMLLTGKTEYSIGKIMAMDYEPTEKFDALDSPRILVSHLYPKHIPKSVIDEKCKIVYIYRNPKDTAVSAHSFLRRLNIHGYKGYEGQWEHYFEFFATKQIQYNSWFEHVKAWLDFKKTNPELPILFMSFEDMKKDLRSCVQKMAEYLGAKQDPEFLDEVTSKCQFSDMVKAKTEDEIETALSKDGSNPFYRKGEVGDWKNWFTVAQNEMYDKVLEENMADIDLEVASDS
ncbi:sulfotransferase family cytosolic 1B member 1-like isoform X1 [Pecten maximus]|uniref:sulfotransferase family cytosolic 1B member 1-like isoform X1 n=1 Tax=Pecten maximus TaxID=6579 RepID=UPI0014586071|nr:sulfotransferase family cytosolic 1B member 1-like isoform X1 [Pecten maximus]